MAGHVERMGRGEVHTGFWWENLRERKLKMVPIGCPETSARNYNSALRNNPQDSRNPLIRMN